MHGLTDLECQELTELRMNQNELIHISQVNHQTHMSDHQDVEIYWGDEVIHLTEANH